MRFQGACHKHFRTLAQAKAFIADWEEIHASIIKATVKEELSKAHRPAEIKGLPAGLSLKTRGNGKEDELIDSFSKIRIEYF